MKNAAVAALLALGMMLGACGVSDEEQPAPPTSSTEEGRLLDAGDVGEGADAFSVAKQALDAESDLGFDYSTLADDPALANFREIQAQSIKEGYRLEGRPTYSGEEVVQEDLAGDPARIEIAFCSDYGDTKLVDSETGEVRESDEGVTGSRLQRFRLFEDREKAWRIFEWKTEESCNG